MARSCSLSKTLSVLVVLAIVCSNASGQLVIAGCANGSCNPTADGGSSMSTSSGTQSTAVEQPAPSGGSNRLIDLLGALGPLLEGVGGAKPGRKLMGHQGVAADSTNMRQLRHVIIAGCAGNSCNPTASGGTSVSGSQTTQTTEVKPAPQESGGNPITDILGGIGDLLGGRRLLGVQQEEQGSVAATSSSLRNLQLPQCVEANLAQCRAWGPSQCGLPGVNDKCPCMCGGQAPGGGSQGPPVVIIKQKIGATGCDGGSCNPDAQGGNAGR